MSDFQKSQEGEQESLPPSIVSGQPGLARRKHHRSPEEIQQDCAKSCGSIAPEILEGLDAACGFLSRTAAWPAELGPPLMNRLDPDGQIRAKYRAEVAERSHDRKRSIAKIVINATRARWSPGHGKADRKTGLIVSAGTRKSITNSNLQIAGFLEREGLIWTPRLPIEFVIAFIDRYRRSVTQGTLNTMKRNIFTFYGITLPALKAYATTNKKDHGLTDEERMLAIHSKKPWLRLCLRILDETGIRSSELLTLAPIASCPPSERNLDPDRFLGRYDHIPYTVHGKGGFKIEVRLSPAISQELETYRLDVPRLVKDEKIERMQYFDVVGPNTLRFMVAHHLKSVLGRKVPPKAFRYSFAQRCLRQFAEAGYDEEKALTLVAQLLGHLSHEKALPYVQKALHSVYPRSSQSCKSKKLN